MNNSIICGPIIRRLESKQLVVWWVSLFTCEGQFNCYLDDEIVLSEPLNGVCISHYRIGEKAVVHLLDLNHTLALDTVIEYDILLKVDTSNTLQPLSTLLSGICYEQQPRCSFIIETQLNNILHGSCRNPHHFSDDSLIAGDNKLSQTLNDCQLRPSILMLSGDQIYADHVAGPMLYAIHKVIKQLGLNDEQLPSNDLQNAVEIFAEQPNYYQRKAMLPLTETTKYWRKNKAKDIFTSAYVHNHLISFSEVCAMYLLVWSPALWESINLDEMPKSEQQPKLQQQEKANLKVFIDGLANVRRLLAHISCYMIFDDHDVTDDWNLTAQWEQTAYQNPLAKRILGNALFGYWLFQGWGNNPKAFDKRFLVQGYNYHKAPTNNNHNLFIDTLLQFNHWHYQVDSKPKMIVLDSRTQRWRSESNLNKPSGLMDWESLCALQQQLIGEEAVILVSPAPIFGVKLIESIQRLATLLGQSLAVDAENWMAHPGSANTVLNIFRHPKTPQHFVILSGDVHYSFVYDIQLRFRNSSPKIWQITSSGIKNQFPSTLIHILDTLNRYLYSVYSPLNWFTKRRDMKVSYRKVISQESIQKPHRRLVEKSSLGYVEFNDDGSPKRILDLHNDASVTQFVESKPN
jgi:hypothetical protein